MKERKPWARTDGSHVQAHNEAARKKKLEEEEILRAATHAGGKFMSGYDEAMSLAVQNPNFENQIFTTFYDTVVLTEMGKPIHIDGKLVEPLTEAESQIFANLRTSLVGHINDIRIAKVVLAQISGGVKLSVSERVRDFISGK